MKWIEIIIVRAANSLDRPVVRRLVDQMMPSGRPQGLGPIILYRNAFVQTDVCIHVQWEMQGHEPARSDLGIELAAALEDFGRVHHTIWVQDGMQIREG